MDNFRVFQHPAERVPSSPSLSLLTERFDSPWKPCTSCLCVAGDRFFCRWPSTIGRNALAPSRERPAIERWEIGVVIALWRVVRRTWRPKRSLKHASRLGKMFFVGRVLPGELPGLMEKRGERWIDFAQAGSDKGVPNLFKRPCGTTIEEWCRLPNLPGDDRPSPFVSLVY